MPLRRFLAISALIAVVAGAVFFATSRSSGPEQIDTGLAQESGASGPQSESAANNLATEQTVHGDAAQRGYETYVRVGCYQCHGYVGQGGLAGPKLAPDPLPAPVIIAYIRNPGGSMPPYAESVLADSAVEDIFAYLASLPAPPAVEDVPLLKGLE